MRDFGPDLINWDKWFNYVKTVSFTYLLIELEIRDSRFKPVST